MHSEQKRTGDILLSYYNVHGTSSGRTVRIHEKTVFRARDRVVVYTRQCTRQRFLRFLPLKQTQTREYLRIPARITTEEQLRDYVAEKKPSWLRQRRHPYR